MIETGQAPDWDRIAARIATRAAKLAETRVEDDLRARQQSPSRWRNPRLLWPLFTQD